MKTQRKELLYNNNNNNNNNDNNNNNMNTLSLLKATHAHTLLWFPG